MSGDLALAPTLPDLTRRESDFNAAALLVWTTQLCRQGTMPANRISRRGVAGAESGIPGQLELIIGGRRGPGRPGPRKMLGIIQEYLAHVTRS
jgi:hypothetical protein